MIFPPGWTPWSGGECPVGDDVVVQVWFRIDKSEAEAMHPLPNEAGQMRWEHQHDAEHAGSGDIIAYKIVEPVA